MNYYLLRNTIPWAKNYRQTTKFELDSQKILVCLLGIGLFTFFICSTCVSNEFTKLDVGLTNLSRQVSNINNACS